ncbi:MAG: sigma-70 family RNA polymerase sigma factor, partial [Phycisphaerales bacterium]|nr:sigma-70 family RNA polymerase sigma factor [Phycisphaerales bacterium]
SRRKVNSNADAEDLVQEIFTEIWKSASRYDPGMGSVATFVAVITRRRVIDHIRRVGRRSINVSLDASPTLVAAAEKTSTGDLSEQSEVILKAISTLRPERQTVLDLSIVHGLSHTQITEATGMPLGTVKAHLRRGLEEVRRILPAQLTAETMKEVSP